ncbi:MAG: hypothetical protein COA79_20780 [Planctomycetota bacterium]|nr:MAG: hypothetical protein COA79_20780 [Planctomycetota bacterium]
MYLSNANNSNNPNVITQRFMILFGLIIFCFSCIGCQKVDNRSLKPVFVHDLNTKQKPWSHLKFKNNPDNFQFAIVSDRTGGAREGIFESAVDRLNILQPEFVVSVGDYIQGNTSDLKKLNSEWDEFEGFVKRLEMPFFYLPGNHDIGNVTMRELWKKKFGRSYYSYKYRDVLFLVLNTQNGKEKANGRVISGLSKEQVTYAKDVLKRNKNVRWTIVLMHEPLWVYEEANLNTASKAKTNKEDKRFHYVQDALEGRNYTVFAGHFHRYQKFKRKKMNYYILASTGGGSQLRGPTFGEFDEVVWVTMTQKGPVFANLTLDGILPEDIYTEEKHKQKTELILSIKKNIVLKEGLKGLNTGRELTCMVKNTFEHGLSVNYKWNLKGTNWVITPESSTLEINKKNEEQITWKIENKYSVKGIKACMPFPRIQIAVVDSSGHEIVQDLVISLLPQDIETLLAASRPELNVNYVKDAPTIDGILKDKSWVSATGSDQFVRDEMWGLPSAKTSWKVCYDKEALYLSIIADEPAMSQIKAKATERDGAIWADDGIEIFIDPKGKGKDYFQIGINTNGILFDSKEKDASWNGVYKVKVVKSENKYSMEVSIPWKTLGLSGLPVKGGEIGINIQRNRTHGGYECLQWAPTGGSSHRPHLFGKLKFK